MNYEEKYNDALERAKYALTTDMDNSGHWAVNYIFPELKESEDERIRKEIIDALSSREEKTPTEWLEWLEKQGQKPKKVSIWKHWKDGICGNGEGKQTYLIKMGNTYSLSSCLGFECDYIELSELDSLMLEQQGEKGPCIGCTNDKGCVTCENGNLKEIKVEPKFKVGDWLQYRYAEPFLVEEITEQGYCNGNSCLPFEWEDEIHLWTIQDSKDGDVLVTTSIRNCPFIYRKTDRNNNLAYYYAGIDGNGDFCEGCLKRTLYHFGSVANVAPATKEQRDLLFERMKEAGYEWDAEKKELKKIEPKMLDADKVIAWLVANICDFEYYVKRFRQDFGL